MTGAGTSRKRRSTPIRPAIPFQGPESTVKIYTYGDSNWKDKLTKYNNQAITYDNSGNPINYRDNWTFTWQKGIQLAGASDGTDTITYGYNPDG